MTTKMDYYGFSKVLKEVANDIHNSDVGITISEVSSLLNQASRVVTDLADEANHYRLRSAMTVVINGEEIELPEDIVDHFYREVASSWISHALRSYLEERLSEPSVQL